MAQKGKVNPDCSYPANPYHECTEACLREAPPQKNKKSSDHGYPSKVSVSSRSEKKKLETETNEHNVSSETGGSPVKIILRLAIFTCLAAIQAMLFVISFPSQRWLLPVAGFLVLLFFILNVLLYLYDRLAATPVNACGIA